MDIFFIYVFNVSALTDVNNIKMKLTTGAGHAVLGDESTIFDQCQLPVVNLESLKVLEAHLNDDDWLKKAVGIFIVCMSLLSSNWSYPELGKTILRSLYASPSKSNAR